LLDKGLEKKTKTKQKTQLQLKYLVARAVILEKIKLAYIPCNNLNLNSRIHYIYIYTQIAN